MSEEKITLGGTQYDLDSLPQSARETIASLQFVEELIRQKSNEWAIADTARMAYAAALKRGVKK